MKKMLLIALVPAIALAQNPPAGCPLLTAAEISAATGMKAGEGHDTSMPTKAGTMSGCMWKLGEQGMANLSVLRAAASKEQRERGLAGLRQVYEGLKAKGWTVTESRFGDVLCNTATPPAAESDHSPAMIGCITAAKGFALSVGVMGPHFKTPPEKVKSLADDVVKRLP